MGGGRDQIFAFYKQGGSRSAVFSETSQSGSTLFTKQNISGFSMNDKNFKLSFYVCEFHLGS